MFVPYLVPYEFFKTGCVMTVHELASRLFAYILFPKRYRQINYKRHKPDRCCDHEVHLGISIHSAG